MRDKKQSNEQPGRYEGGKADNRQNSPEEQRANRSESPDNVVDESFNRRENESGNRSDDRLYGEIRPNRPHGSSVEHDRRGFEERGTGQEGERSNPDNRRNQPVTGEEKKKKGSGRGFASMDPEAVRNIASMGGRAAHASGKAHELTSAEARKAARARWR